MTRAALRGAGASARRITYSRLRADPRTGTGSAAHATAEGGVHRDVGQRPRRSDRAALVRRGARRGGSLGPAVPATRTGSVVFWCSRLLAAAALGSLALNAYSIIESQSGNNSTTDSIELANGLILALYDTGVLAGLAAGLAVLGPWLIARAEGLDELEAEATVEG
jgi:hypothetical protein